MAEKQAQIEGVTSQNLLKAFDRLHKKDFAAAQKLLETALAEAQESCDPAVLALVHTGFGVYHKLKKDFKAAWRSYQQAEKLLPDDPSLKLITGRLLVEVFKQYDEALAKMKRVMELAPQDPVCLHQAQAVMAVAHWRLGHKKTAVELFEKMMAGAFQDLRTAGNIDLSVVEFFTAQGVFRDLCECYLQQALAFAKARREKTYADFFEQLLQAARQNT